jgi:cytidylate kinase
MKELGLRRTKGSHLLEPSDEFAAQFPPFITISRDPGSGGKPIAKLVAKKLKFKLYDKQIISDIAKSAKLRKSLLEEVDEKGRNLMTDFVHTLLNPDYVSDVDYMRHLFKVILSVAYKGKVVILGRGGNFITPAAAGLHVRITAPYKVRVRRAIQYEDYTLEQAKDRIREVTHDRKEFITQYFGKNIRNPKYYDLTLNTTFYTLEQSAKVILEAFKQKFTKGTM